MNDPKTDTRRATPDTGRRRFLMLAGTAAPAALAAAATSTTMATPAMAAAPAEAPAKGLRQTAHSRAYYDSARF